MRAIVLASTALAFATPAYAQSLSVSDVTCTEGQSCPVTITRSGNKGSTASFSYKTVNGDAAAGYDYVGKSGQQSVRKNATKITINVGTLDDTTIEQTEKLFFDISPLGGVTATKARGVITILDNDVAKPVEQTPLPVPEPTTGELPSVPSNFDVSSQLRTVPPAPSGGPDEVVGAFRFTCNAGQLLYDDPIVFPGQPGKAHLHQFFGNLSADGNSTYASLRAAGETTCMSKLNRSAYWMPAMLNGKGQVVRPDYITIYYKRYPKGSPYCAPGAPTDANKPAVGDCRILPRGLRYIFGYDMLKDADPAPNSHYFTCEGAYRSNNIVDTAKGCQNGQHLGATVVAPMCWTGNELDSANHQDHMAYPSYGWWGYLRCPPSHPYVLADFAMVAWFTVDDTLDKSGAWPLTDGKTTWSLSCDNMPGMMPRKPGECLHADWFGAWDDPTLQTWHDNCIDKKLSCNSFDLGNGTAGVFGTLVVGPANPRLVPIPVRP